MVHGTDYTDPVFPVASPEFLFVHTVTIGDQDSVITNPDGTWSRGPVPTTPTRGYMTGPNPRDIARAASRGEVVDAVLLCPHGTPVSFEDRVDATASTAPSIHRAVFSVVAVRPNPSHVRVLLTRITGDPTPRT